MINNDEACLIAYLCTPCVLAQSPRFTHPCVVPCQCTTAHLILTFFELHSIKIKHEVGPLKPQARSHLPRVEMSSRVPPGAI